jgi:hypothetical protein
MAEGRRTVPVAASTRKKIQPNVRDEEFAKWQIFLRQELSSLLKVFYAANGCLLAFMALLLIVDCIQIFGFSSSPNFHIHIYLTQPVLLALIAATAAQLGAMAAAAASGMLRQINLEN